MGYPHTHKAGQNTSTGWAGPALVLNLTGVRLQFVHNATKWRNLGHGSRYTMQQHDPWRTNRAKWSNGAEIINCGAASQLLGGGSSPEISELQSGSDTYSTNIGSGAPYIFPTPEHDDGVPPHESGTMVTSRK